MLHRCVSRLHCKDSTAVILIAIIIDIQIDDQVNSGVIDSSKKTPKADLLTAKVFASSSMHLLLSSIKSSSYSNTWSRMSVNH